MSNEIDETTGLEDGCFTGERSVTTGYKQVEVFGVRKTDNEGNPLVGSTSGCRFVLLECRILESAIESEVGRQLEQTVPGSLSSGSKELRNRLITALGLEAGDNLSHLDVVQGRRMTLCVGRDGMNSVVLAAAPTATSEASASKDGV